jgi:hypothetical protein
MTPFDPAIEAVMSLAAGSIEETRFAEWIRKSIRTPYSAENCALLYTEPVSVLTHLLTHRPLQ